MQRKMSGGEGDGTLSPQLADDSPMMQHRRGDPFASKEVEGLMSVADIASEDESKLSNRSQ